MRLRRSDCQGVGLTRRRAGRGFTYHRADGTRVNDDEVLARIKALAIPPAWTDVWICPHANGHIQALGTDARGRRQYRYHDAWRERRDAEKFDRMRAFGKALPRVRAVCGRELEFVDASNSKRSQGGGGSNASGARAGASNNKRNNGGSEGSGIGDLTLSRVLAAAVRLLDLGFFRIGTEEYAEENETYGLATMRKEHVRVEGDLVTFDYPAKGGRQRLQSVVDPAVSDVIAALKRRRGGGPELLAYRDRETGRWCDVRSADINAFVKEHMGADFTAKDFRTWNATVLCAVALAVSAHAGSATARKRAVRRAIEEVAHYLGNTPAVCRKSYVDPRVIDQYDNGTTIAAALHRLGDDTAFGQLATQGAVERAVLRLLAGA
jgi:DNA topoisomerase I